MSKAEINEDGWVNLVEGEQECPFCGTVLRIDLDEESCVILLNGEVIASETNEVFELPCCEGDEKGEGMAWLNNL